MMSPLLFLLLTEATLVVTQEPGALQICTEPACSALLLRAEPDLQDVTTGESIFLGRDAKSGCNCKFLPGKFTVCFSQEFCKRFPRDLSITTPSFRLKATQIPKLSPGDLENYRNLQSLLVEANSNLSAIESGTFEGMTKLRVLSISYNPNLREIKKGAFEGLVALEELNLVKNGFEAVPSVTLGLSKATLPHLSKLNLSQNNFFKLSNGDFEAMRNSSLKTLKLFLCQIEVIEPGTLGPLSNLESLGLGENNLDTDALTTVIRNSTQEIPLKHLNLCSVGLRKIPPKPLMEAIGTSNISNLDISKNQFEVITKNTFPSMPSIEILDLSQVLALNITDDAFSTMPSLKILLLSENRLASIPQGVLLESLVYLDMQQNSGSSFYATYFALRNQGLVGMKNLQVLNLSFNNIYAVYNNSLSGLTSLKSLLLKNASLYNIWNGSFRELAQLEYLNVENNFLLKNYNGSSSGMFDGLRNLQVLLLGGCGIPSIPAEVFRPLIRLKRLGLDRNKLSSLRSSDFRFLRSLNFLDLSQNSLQSWEGRIFLQNRMLKALVLNHNKITHITEGMVEDFKRLAALEASGNPFFCDCSTSFSNLGTFLKLVENQSISCAYPETTTNLTLQEFGRVYMNSCGVVSAANARLTVMVPLVVLFMTSVIISILVFYYRWHLRYWLFLTRLYLSRTKKRRKRKTASYTNYTYDAFVSYSNEDRNFVIRLVTMLENYPPNLKLCVYERDFEIGTIISESILESVARSRRTLLVISDSYAKSQWCRWESQIAEHHRLFFENEDGDYVDDSLILVKLGPVSENHLTPTLKFLLKTRIYLQWDPEEKKQKAFWERLRNALAPPPEIIENTHL